MTDAEPAGRPETPGVPEGGDAPGSVQDRLAAAARELLTRSEDGEAVGAGAATAAGWSVVARTELGPGEAGAASHLWALRCPAGGGIHFVATGAQAPEPWTGERVGRELEARRRAAAAAERFALGVEAARASSRTPGRAVPDRVERIGPSELHFVDGEPVRAARVLVLGAEDAGPVSDAWRVDRAEAIFGQAGSPLAEQVWARPLAGPGGHWRRGRLRLGAQGAVFADEPHAATGARGDRRPDGKRNTPNLEADLLGCGAVRRKAAASEVYAAVLCSTLADSVWRHEGWGSTSKVARRDAPRLAAQMVGVGDFTDWLWPCPAMVLDEEVATDLGALGWRRVGWW